MKSPGRASLTLFLIAIILAIAGPAIFAGECPLASNNIDYHADYASKIGLPRCDLHNIKKWSACEICMISDKIYTSTSTTNPYTDSYYGNANLQPSATFNQPGMAPVKVDGFFDGFFDVPSGKKAIFRIRFTPTINPNNTVGYTTMSSDGGMNNITGTITVTNRALPDRGFLRQDSVNNPRTFVWDDGNHPFVWGNTFYQIVNHARLPQSQEGLWKDAITKSRDKGLNKIRLVVSPWGKDPRYPGADSRAFARTGEIQDYDKLDLLNWEALDRVTNFLKQQGMIADLILFHDGDNTSSPYAPGNNPASVERNRRFTRYVVARYGAFTNVIWTLSNEYQNVNDLLHQDKGQWDDLGCVIRGCGNHAAAGAADPWLGSTGAGRPLSIHNNISDGGNGNPPNPGYPCFAFFGAPGWATDVVLQTRRKQQGLTIDQLAGKGVLQNVPNATVEGCAGLTSILPIVNDEYGYIGENNVDRVGHRQASWAVAAAGGFGSIGDVQEQVTGEDCAPDKPGNQPCSPTLYTVWTKPQPAHYSDIQSLIDYFTKPDNGLNAVWWQMKTVLKNELTSNNARVYGSRGPRDAVVYAVGSGTATKLKFSLKLLPGEYNAVFKDLGTGTVTTAVSKSQTIRGTKLVSIPFQTTFPSAWSDVITHIHRTKSFSANKAALTEDDEPVVDETAWVWDEVPAGATVDGVGEGWNWIDDNPVPISDNLAHASNLVLGQMHQHFFTGASETLPVAAGDFLYAYIYLDEQYPPTQVMLQWNDGSWEHRAYWGANQIGWGVNGTNSRRYMGALPIPGRWVRLEVPASAVGLEGKTLNGMAFTLFGGKATWDEAGRAAESVPQCSESFITQQPQSQTIIPGASATLSVAVSGTADFNYQFYQAPVGVYQNPTGISTATITTGPIYTTKEYWAEINDTCQGTFLRSEAAIVTVECTAAPAITQQPTTRVTSPGQYTTLSVSSYQGVNYQWYSGGAPISGATSPTLSVNPQSTTTYWAKVTNGCGFADSAVATVCVKPRIDVQPAPRTINPGQSATLSVTAINAASYQWYTGTAPSTATPILNATGSTITVSPSANTNYWVQVINSCETVNSTTATVTVAPVPSAQISRIQSVSVLANSQQSVTARWTQPTQPGTFLVAVISGLKDPAQLAWTAPAGWQLAVDQEWPNVKLAIYYLPNNAGARTAETFTVAQGYHDMTLYVAEYSGMVAVNPLDRIGGTGDYTNSGYVQTGFTPNTSQAKELVITALSTYTQTEFSVTPADGYTELYDQSLLYHLTTAMYQKITTATGSYGHGATVYAPAEWAGVVATFRGAN